MAATKTILALSDTGQTLYAVVRRALDGYFLNDADGAFAAAPSDRYLSFSEDGTVKGLYSLTENRTAWDDGKYDVLLYSQTGGSPATASDFPIGEDEIEMQDDAEILSSSSVDLTGVRVLLSRINTSLSGGDKKILDALAVALGGIRPAILDLQQSFLRGRK